MILQAWNTQTNTDLSLSGPVGQVYAMAVGNDLLFAGTQVIILQVAYSYFSFEFHVFSLLLFLVNCFSLMFLLAVSVDELHSVL